jgi:spermidine/putrescine ABC transporter ATP-binding subunit
MYLKLESLSKKYGEVIAVDKVSLDINKGEFITLLGPSGSGKTTILRMIAGFTTPTAGHIKIDGQPIENKPPHKRNLGMVFQDYSLFPHMNIYQNVAFGLRMRKVSKEAQEHRVAQALETVQLTGYETRRPDQLSGGQRQRVALARAIIIEPLVLLLDEPLGALDRKLREEMQVELRRIHDLLDVTTIFVTHDQDEALAMSDRIAILNEGKLHQVGTPFDVYERPASTFVADFLGKANIFWLSVVESNSQQIEAEFNGGPVIILPPDENVKAGDQVQILVRPEQIILCPGLEPQYTNNIPCKIERVIYLGSGAYVILKGPDDIRLTAYISAPQLAEKGVLEKGLVVGTAWSESASTILDYKSL